jgi:biotin carboxyl carrier protein
MAKIVLDGVAREVVIERGKDGVVVVVDGRRHAVSNIDANPGALTFFLGNAPKTAYVSSGPTGTRISLNGRTYARADARPDADAPLASAGARDGRIEAPMPGGIIALHVHAGDHVTVGQPVAVLESMKMHNEITAPVDGVVQRVNVKVGEQVSFGHVLAEIAAE